MTLTLQTIPRARISSIAKVGAIVAVALATAVPGMLVSQLVGEREDRATSVHDEIVRAWGPAQRVGGPTLVLVAADKSDTTRFLAVVPRNLDVHATITPTMRRRGLFATTVYEAALTMTGSFELPEGFRDGGPEHLKTDTTLLAVRLTGTQGVRDEDRAEVGGRQQPWQACADLVAGGGCRPDVLVVEADLAKAQGATLPFKLTLHLRGTGGLRIATAAKHATTDIKGDWPSPSFVGTDLPTATTTDGGFTARWTQDRIGQPRYTKASDIAGIDNIAGSVGVDLIEGTPVYRTINRVSKYGLLIVAMAFATYFLFEVAAGVGVTLFQYAMLGASLSLFTLLLLSVSEIAGYETGYTLSALLVVAQASLYTWSVTRRAGPAAVFATMLATKFGFFYLLLGVESYALVLGAVALFVVLSVVMGVTQSVSGAASLRAPT